MSVAQQSFADAIEHRLQRWWPKATVTYVGGGWFVYRTEPFMPASKVRRRELLRKARDLPKPKEQEQ